MGSISGWWRYPLEKGMATNSSILAWRIPMDKGAWQAIVHRVSKSWTWLKQLNTHTHRSYSNSIFNIFKKCQTVSSNICSNLYSNQQCMKILGFFLTILFNTCYYLFFDYRHPTGCEMIVHYDCSLFLSPNLFPWLSFVFDPFSSLST